MGHKSMAKRKKTDFVQFKVRFREGLRARLEATAKAQERSLNGEIVARLEESFVRDRGREEREELLKTFKHEAETLVDRVGQVAQVLARWEARVSAADPKAAEAIRGISHALEPITSGAEAREARKRQGDES